MTKPSFRAQLVTRRTYNRPKGDDETAFETWENTCSRVMAHQAWLWERAKGEPLTGPEWGELQDLWQLMVDRKLSVSGRTLWLGGTAIAKTREASQFNCSFTRVEDVYDIVDSFWLLLQGCGVGFAPETGTLSGFTRPVDVMVVPSSRSGKGRETNEAWIDNWEHGSTYYLSIGDSAEAWAKAVGKLVTMKEPVDAVVLDFSEIRPAGTRLKGYGWICSGDATFGDALTKIAEILNKRAGQLLTKIDILDVMNLLGTTLSSRRSAEICVMDADDIEAEAFSVAKRGYWKHGNEHRAQSNNSLVFWHRPSKNELRGIFHQMIESGGSEPGFINGREAQRRAPWFKGVNPCAEILLGNKSFCNLVEVDWGKFAGEEGYGGLLSAIRLAARANYRQTCVNLKDGVLSESWHELNDFLRLCGVGCTGLVKYLDAHGSPADAAGDLDTAHRVANEAAYSMARELGTPPPQAVTTVKPSGTLSKIMDTTEGVHRPLGKYIFNNIQFSVHDPLVETLRGANYRVFPHPFDKTSVMATVPVAYEDVEFTEVDGKEVNVETAVDQLERYKLLMDNYVDHNCSITVSYDPSEVGSIVEWIYENWESYVGVSWVFRNDPTKTAEDLGFPYLPQEVVTREEYEAYVATLLPVNLDDDTGDALVDDECSTGACPIR